MSDEPTHAGDETTHEALRRLLDRNPDVGPSQAKAIPEDTAVLSANSTVAVWGKTPSARLLLARFTSRTGKIEPEWLDTLPEREDFPKTPLDLGLVREVFRFADVVSGGTKTTAASGDPGVVTLEHKRPIFVETERFIVSLAPRRSFPTWEDEDP